MEHFDVIVIGSGAGGGTLTHALAPTGKRILLLERGDYLEREPENWSSRSIWVDVRYRNSGRWTDAGTGKTFLPKQHYYVGGNTKFYGAVLFRKRVADFGEVVHADGISPAWPLTYADMEPWYTAAERLYHVHGERGVDPSDPPSPHPYPHAPVSHEPRIEQLAADFRRAGLHPFPLPLGIMIDEDRPHTSPCIRCQTCDGFPCLVQAKADAHVVCVAPALAYPNVSLMTNARVTRLETTGDGRRVDHVVVQHGGETLRLSADVVVVSAGAINSAALLLQSANDHHPHGLGNGSGVVGRHLMLHNNSSLIAFSHEENPTRFQKTLGVNDFYPTLGAIQMLGRSDAVTVRLDDPDAADPEALARHSLDFWLTTEDIPRWGNRVTVSSDGAVSLRYEPSNLSEHAELVQRFKGLLDSIGCTDRCIERPTYIGGRLGINGVAHQNGTVRFGHDPATSALDIDCRLHEVDNCYVVDSSFFPSSSAVNPTLTIIANALRVAQHLCQRLDARVPQEVSA